MKRTVKVIVAFAAALALAFAFCGCTATTGSYTPEKKEATVKAPAIGEDGTLRVGVNSSNAPFSAQVSGSIVGIDVDMAAAIADQMGLELEIVDVGSDPESALEKGTVDIVMGVASTDTTVSCWMSDPYVSSASAIFASDEKAEVPTADTKDLTIEATASSMSAGEVSNQFGDDALKSVDKLKVAFEDLASGKVDYVAADAIIGSYMAHANSYEAHMLCIMETPTDYCVGAASSNTDLQKALNDALDALSKDGIVKVIEKKWLGFALDLDSAQKTEGADKQDSSQKEKSEAVDAAAETADTGTVGSNAVEIVDDGSTQG